MGLLEPPPPTPLTRADALELGGVRALLWGSEVLDAVLALCPVPLAGVARIADLGCGRGLLGRLLLSRWPKARIDGYDLDEGTIAAARRASGAHRGCLTFSVGDAGSLDVRGGYDLVVAQALLVHQSRPQDVVGQALHLLRPGGGVLLVEPDVAAVFDIFDPRPTHLPDPWPALVVGAERGGAGDWGVSRRLGPLLTDAGFEGVSVHDHPGRYTLDGEDGERLREHLLGRDPEDERAHLELLGNLHRGGGGDPADWARYADAIEVGRASLRRSLRAGEGAIERWGGLRMAVGRRRAL